MHPRLVQIASVLAVVAFLATFFGSPPPDARSSRNSQGPSNAERIMRVSRELTEAPGNAAQWQDLGRLLARTPDLERSLGLWAEGPGRELESLHSGLALARYFMVRARISMWETATTIAPSRQAIAELWAPVLGPIESVLDTHSGPAVSLHVLCAAETLRRLERPDDAHALVRARMGECASEHLEAFVLREWFVALRSRAPEPAILDLCLMVQTELVRRLEGPRGARALYNLACIHALRGEQEQAIAAIDAAARAGWSDHRHATNDQDLASLRGLPGFESVLDRVRADQP